ncbi:hypothetical protein ACHAXH_000530 [Discostella pseudostelligera]
MRPKKSRPSRRRTSIKGKSGKSNADTFDEIEEKEYFAKSETQYRLQRTSDRSLISKGDNGQSTKKSVATKVESENKGAYWLPPPPFSSSVRGENGAQHDNSLKGQRVIRRPVKFLGKAGSLSHELPRESIGLAEIAIAGRSNVGKSTLLNALLYGNTDENLSPRQYQRGGTPDRTKLPKGVKAEASSKPGQTKELSFYQLTADVVTENDSYDETEKDNFGKMSLLLVDLPGYGFALAREERTIEWKNLMHHYLLERRSLKRILLLLDARHGFKKTDFDFLGDLQDGLMAKTYDKKAKRELPPIQIVLTKCDLVRQTDLARRVVIVKKQLSDFLIREPSALPVMLVSARAGVGYNNLRKETPMGGVLELQRELASLVPKPRCHGRKTT